MTKMVEGTSHSLQNTSGSRNRCVDIAKGIAIICIILGHLNNNTINRFVFTFHVPIFFIISGYYISETTSLGAFVKKKARTLLVPYFITCLVMIPIGTYIGYVYDKDAQGALWRLVFATLYAAGDYYAEPFVIYPIGAIWFLWALFWASLFLKFALQCRPGLRIAMVAALFAFGYCSRQLFWFPLSIQAGACATFYLYTGYLLKKMDIRRFLDNLSPSPAHTREIKLFLSAFSFLTWAFFIRDFRGFWLVHCDFGRGIVDVFGSLCACACVMLISGWIDKKCRNVSRVLSYLGRYSLVVLCVHIIELNLIDWDFMLDLAGVPLRFFLPLKIAGKLLLDCGGSWAFSQLSPVRRAFGFPDLPGENSKQRSKNNDCI